MIKSYSLSEKRSPAPGRMPETVYSAYAEKHRQVVRTWVERCSGLIVPGAGIIDVGCGYRTSEPEVRNGMSNASGILYVAADYVPPQAHVSPKEEQETAAQSLVASGYCLPFRDSSFDAAVCTEVLEHVSDPDSLIAETGRVLREEAILILATVGPHFPFHQRPPQQYDYGRNNLLDIVAGIERGGFRVVEAHDAHTDSRDDMQYLFLAHKS